MTTPTGFNSDMTAISDSVSFEEWCIENSKTFETLSPFEKEDVRAYYKVYTLFYTSLKNTIKLISNSDEGTNKALLLDLCHHMAMLYKNRLPADIDMCSKIFVTSQTSIIEALQK